MRDLTRFFSSFEHCFQYRVGLGRCVVTNKNGSPCRNPAQRGIHVPACGRHANQIERVWDQEVERAAQIRVRQILRNQHKMRVQIPEARPRGGRTFMQSGVYFVGARHPKFGPVIKIGVATSISHRLAQLNYYGFVPLRLLAVELMPRDEAAWREKELHRAFSQQRVCGEWFVDRDPLSSFVRNIETLVEREKGEVA